MSLTKTTVNRPTTVLIIFLLAIGFGLYTASNLAIDLFPEINPPVLMVFTSYPGAGPEEVETVVTRTLEGALSNVSNIRKITSTSSEGSSQVQLEFTWGTNMAEASNDVRDSLEFVKDLLPDAATTPQIFKFDPSMIPILQLEVSGNRSPEELRSIAEKTVQPRIEQVEGVALAGVMGGRERAIRVEVSPNRLAAYDLTMNQIVQALQSQNVQITGGSITQGNTSYLIRTAGEYQDINQIKNTVITYKGAPPTPAAPAGGASLGIRLRDVANVSDGYRKTDNNVFVNGKPGVFVIVQKQSGTNSVKTADNVISRLAEVNQVLPVGVRVNVIYDTTEIIRRSLSEVSSAAVTGALLAVIILFVFLRSIRSTLIIGLAIPISLVVTLTVMYFAGLTLNLMTLTGLALGVGMLVDNSIVILENIFRYREKGSKLQASAVLGTQEMINAIVASTLTTIFVFAPVAVFRGQLEWVGELFSDLAFTVVISLGSSLLVAMFLVPVLSSRYLPLSSRKQRPLSGLLGKLDGAASRAFSGLDNAYKRAIASVLRHKVITLLIVVVVFGGSLAMVSIIGFEFMPQQEDDVVQLDLKMPMGTTLDVTERVAKQFESMVRRDVKGYKDIILNVGERSFFGFAGASQTNKANILITLPPYAKRQDSYFVIRDKLRVHFNDFPGATFSFSQGGGGLGGGSPIDILVQSSDLTRARQVAERIQTILRDHYPAVTEPQVNMESGLPEVAVRIDRDKAYALGLNVATIGQEVRANIDGVTAGKFRTGGNEYDILVISTDAGRDQVVDLQGIYVTNVRGERIPLSSFASFDYGTGPVSISREDQRRTVHVTGGLAPGSKLNQLVPEIRGTIQANIPSDEDLLITFSGDYENLMKQLGTFAAILAVSIFLVFGVMASQFESFLDPFIIIFTVPLLVIGVIWMYFITGETLSVFTAVGMVVLVGIVVNNGIVLVDYTNLMHKRGLSVHDACIEAGGNRLRPILMTTLTTVLGLIPVAFFKGESGSLIQPIAKTVVGGLSVATLLTLFVVPVIYAIFNNRIEKRKAKRETKMQARIEREHEARPLRPDSTTQE